MWDWEIVRAAFPELLSAVRITIAATVVGFLIALFGGLMLTLARRSTLKPIAWIAAAFMEFIRSTPLLIQVFFIYYTLPLYGISVSAFTVGVLGLGIHYSTYLSEVYRAGIEAIPKGQWEVARALNFSKTQTWIRIILPQAIPPVTPMLGNYLITMFKETPILSAITLVELLLQAKLIGSKYFSYQEVFTLVGLFFLVLSYPSSLLVQRMEIWLNRRYGRTV